MTWRILLVVLLIVGFNLLAGLADREAAWRRPLPQHAPDDRPGDARPLPAPSPDDPGVIVETPKRKQDASGTAFSLPRAGWWMTARHVAGGCSAIQLRFPRARTLSVDEIVQHPGADLALLHARRPGHAGLPLRRAALELGQHGFFIGYPQGFAGEAWGSLMGRMRMRSTGRYATREPILAWAERARKPRWLPRLGGLSGGPALDPAGRVIGVVLAESPRRGRVYTAAPESMAGLNSGAPGGPLPPFPITPRNLSDTADDLREEARVARVLCRAGLQQYER